MCGIVGAVNIGLEKSALDSIEHRGPDDFGQEEYIVADHSVILAHRRLSIIDLSPAGHQPMATTCSSYSIIFNGEIYNHQELRDRLPAGIHFKGHSDTETILYYLKEFGIDGIKDFNGIFSFAFLDRVKNNLLLVRDPFGVKPLYYRQSNSDDLVFSSEIRPIRTLFPDLTIDKNALATFLRLRYNPAPNTIYQTVQKLKPGHYIKIDFNGDKLNVLERPYIEEVPGTISTSRKASTNLYGEHLEAAIKRQLLSDVEVGIMLSGGIDSAVVAAIAQKNYPGKLKAFTIGFEGNYDEDEIDDAAVTAELLGLDHYTKKITFNDFLNVIKTCCTIVEEPLATTSIIPMYYLSQLAGNYVKVVLTGQGADEPLGGYTRYRLELLRQKLPTALQKLIVACIGMLPTKIETLQRGVGALTIENIIERFVAVYEVFTTKEIQQLIFVDEKQSIQHVSYFYDLLHCSKKPEPVERMMALDTRLNLSDDLLNYTDKITMHFSIECRVPMLDKDLVSYIESLPAHLKLNLANGGKIIHKEYARKILPSAIINRKKKAFQSPTKWWFKQQADVIEQLLLEKGTTFSTYFNQKEVARIINLHKQGYNKEKQIFMLLNIYFLLDSFRRS